MRDLELHNTDCSTSNIRLIKTKKVKGHVTCKIKSTHKDLVERPRHKWNYNIKIKLKYDVCGRDLSNSERKSVAAIINK
jgi:hypothetical protein